VISFPRRPTESWKDMINYRAVGRKVSIVKSRRSRWQLPG